MSYVWLKYNTLCIRQWRKGNGQRKISLPITTLRIYLVATNRDALLLRLPIMEK